MSYLQRRFDREWHLYRERKEDRDWWTEEVQRSPRGDCHEDQEKGKPHRPLPRDRNIPQSHTYNSPYSHLTNSSTDSYANSTTHKHTHRRRPETHKNRFTRVCARESRGLYDLPGNAENVRPDPHLPSPPSPSVVLRHSCNLGFISSFIKNFNG